MRKAVRVDVHGAVEGAVHGAVDWVVEMAMFDEIHEALDGEQA